MSTQQQTPPSAAELEGLVESQKALLELLRVYEALVKAMPMAPRELHRYVHNVFLPAVVAVNKNYLKSTEHL